MLALDEQAYAGESARQAAFIAANDASANLLGRLQGLDEEQLIALIQQDHGSSSAELIDRVLRYWDRPRLLGVDWLRCGRSRRSTFISSVGQDQDWTLEPRSRVMLAGDGFPDLHGIVREVLNDEWRVEILWGATDG